MSYTKDYSIVFPTQSSGRSWSGLGSPPSYSVKNRIITVVRQRTGDRMPNWREKIAKGDNATTNLTGTWESLDYRNFGHLYQKWYRSDLNAYFQKEMIGDLGITNSTIDFVSESPSLSSNFVDNLARAAFYKKLHALTTQFQGMIFLGELRETLYMLRHPVASLHAVAKDFLGLLGKRKKAKPKSWQKDIAALWLEQAFGWSPLINDVYDAITAYRRLTEPNQSVRISAGSKKAYDTTSTMSSFNQSGATWNNALGAQMTFLVVRGLKRETHVVRYKGAVRALTESPQWKDYSLFGFQPLEFVPTVWELLPWSFLVDYFANVGDILDASVTRTQDVTYVNKSTVRFVDKVLHLRWYPEGRGGVSDPHWVVISQQGDTSPRQLWYKKREVIRQADSGISAPTLQFNFSLSDGQLGNCAALLAQANHLHPQDKIVPWSDWRRRH